MVDQIMELPEKTKIRFLAPVVGRKEPMQNYLNGLRKRVCPCGWMELYELSGKRSR